MWEYRKKIAECWNIRKCQIFTNENMDIAKCSRWFKIIKKYIFVCMLKIWQWKFDKITDKKCNKILHVVKIYFYSSVNIFLRNILLRIEIC